MDKGFPTAALHFDREQIPLEAARLLAKAAYYDSKLSELSKGTSKQ